MVFLFVSFVGNLMLGRLFIFVYSCVVWFCNVVICFSVFFIDECVSIGLSVVSCWFVLMILFLCIVSFSRMLFLRFWMICFFDVGVILVLLIVILLRFVNMDYMRKIVSVVMISYSICWVGVVLCV